MKDVAFIVDDSLMCEEIVKEIKRSGGKLLTDIKIFDIYIGDKIPENKKSLAFNLTFEDMSRTLKEEVVMVIFNKIILNVTQKFKAFLRDK